MLKNILLVGLGGAVGSIMRFYSGVIIKQFSKTTLPITTLMVNVIGSLIIGILIGYFAKIEHENANLKLLLITGFCGGFTTFSAFAAENISLIQSNETSTAMAYIAISVIASLIAVWLGLLIVKG